MSYLDNIRTFVRVYELGSMSAAGRDLRISPAVTSARISQLEDHLGVRLFQRTTRSLTATEQGRAFYGGACEVLDALQAAEAGVMDLTDQPRGSLFVAAPLGMGRRVLAPEVPGFLAQYPDISLRLRLTDRKVDIATEGLDLAFFLGPPEDRTLRIRKLAARSDRLAVLEGLSDLENVGAVVRVAAALGLGGVIVDHGSADHTTDVGVFPDPPPTGPVASDSSGGADFSGSGLLDLVGVMFVVQEDWIPPNIKKYPHLFLNPVATCPRTQ